MSDISNSSIQRKWWRKLTGNPGEFTMENRAFNYISIISFGLLIYYFVISLYLHQSITSVVIVILACTLGVLYYYSRFKKKHQAGIIVYAICSYLALILNFYINDGIDGPSMCLFFITFHILIAVAKPKQYPMWITLHIGIVFFLLASEYFHPEWVPDTYQTRKDRFIDLAGNYFASIAFAFAITNYLRKYLNNKKTTAEQSTKALLEINKQILEQNKELEKVNQEKNKLFSIVSHDLKSPLDSIMGYLEILSGNVDQKERTILEQQLLDQTKYTSDMLLNLLSWARTQMQGVRVNLVALNIRDLVEKIARNKISITAKKDIKLTYTIDPQLEVIADSDMLHIIIRNLVNNAIKFTNEGGNIFIRVVRKGKEVLISVEDTGMGIPPEKQTEIFTLKTQSTFGTNHEKGIGIGLMMCKEFVAYQNGKIWFESQVGIGTTFYLQLPAALR